MKQGEKQSVEFILLHSTKYGDSSLVLHTLSREFGRRSFFLRSVCSASAVAGGAAKAGGGAKRGGSRAAVAGMVSPMNIIEGEVAPVRSSPQAMPAVGALSSVRPLTGIRGDLRKGCITVFMAEVLFRALRDGASEDGLYEWCRSKILLLDALEGNFVNFHLIFLLELTAALGFRPEFRDIAPFIPPEHAAVAESLLKLPFEEALLVPMTGAVRSDLVDSFLAYFETHLEYPLNIRSAAVLKDLFRQ